MVLFQNQYLAVIERDGYIFARAVYCNGIKVALLPFQHLSDDIQIRFLARLEICPAHGEELVRSSITGGLEQGKSVKETACQELWEEAGYRIGVDELIDLGVVRPAKDMDTVVHLFAVNVTDRPRQTPPGDGSHLESIASVEWVDFEQGVQIEDPLFVTAITRLKALSVKRS